MSGSRAGVPFAGNSRNLDGIHKEPHLTVRGGAIRRAGRLMHLKQHRTDTHTLTGCVVLKHHLEEA